MTKLIFAFLWIICLLPIKASIYDPSYSGQINPKIIQIFNLFLEEKKFSEKTDLLELNNFAQKNFIRPKMSERSSPEAYSYYENLFNLWKEKKEERINEIIKIFTEMGDIGEVLPSKNFKAPDYIVIPGSTIHNMRERLAFVDNIVKKKLIDISKTQIVFSIGYRKLFPSETKEELVNPAPYAKNPSWQAPEKLPDNENDCAEFIWEQMELSAELRAKYPIIIKANVAENANRATTEICARDFWNNKYIKPGKVLVISSNPFIEYQLGIFGLQLKHSQRLDKDQFTLAGSGPAPVFPLDKIDSKILGVGILLDNLARSIYTEIQKKQ